jgi:anaerobic magnesium-protoporphyrin IX monomethyl ester cyclase
MDREVSAILKQKIVLYNPKAVFFTMPLGLMAIASCLDKSKYDVRIIDGRLEDDAVARVLEELDGALCLGVSVLTGAPISDALRILRAAKSRYPEVTTVCGGWHPSLFPEEMLDESSIDITVQGQGEATFTEVVAHLDRGEPLDDVRGATFRNNGERQRNPERPMMPMEVFPPMNYGLIPVERYFKLKGRRQLDYISSTGCLFRCAFCADPFVNKRSWQAIGSERLADELETLWTAYRFEDLNFQDETFFTYKSRVAEVAEQFLSRDMSFSWAATMRADQGVRLGEDVFKLCVKSGMRRVLIGVESGSPAMLKRIKKDTTIDQIVSSAEMCARNNVAVIFSFIVGFPDETPDEVMQTVSLIKKLRSMSPNFETPIFYYKPYPGSEISAEFTAEMPQSLEAWAEFDYVQGAAGRWVSPEMYQFMERFKFYNRYAWGGQRIAKRPLQLLARWRCQHNWFNYPFEKTIVQRLRPEIELS